MLYVNPGYIELLDGPTSGATVNNGNNLYFYNTKNTYNLNISGYRELYVKLNVVVGGNSNARIYVYINNNNVPVGAKLNADGTYNDWNFNNNALNVIPKIGRLVNNHEYEIMIHAKSGNNDGLKEIYFNGVLDSSFTGNINNGDAFPGIIIQADNPGVLFHNIIIADFDIADYHIAQCDVKSYETNFEKQSDGSLKAATAGEYLSSIIDTAALETEMKKNVTSAEIVGVNVSAFNVSYDSNVINALKSSIDGTDSEDLTITNNNVAGKVLTVNPALNKTWTLDQLKTASFKLTSEKV